MMALCGQRSPNTLAILLVLLLLAACGAPTGAGGSATSAVAASATPTRRAAPASASGERGATVAPVLVAITATGAPPTVSSNGAIADPTAAAAVPLTVTPAAGPAGSIFTITGAGLPTDAVLYALGSGPDQPLILNRRVTVSADGLLSVEFNSLGRPPGAYSVAISRRDVQADALRVIAQGTFTISEGGPVPTLTLDPDSGFCATQSPVLFVQGHNFPPDTSFGLAAIQVAPYRPSPVSASFKVAADGTFAGTIFLTGCGPTTPEGTQFQVNAVRFEGPMDPRRAVTSATFVVSSSAAPLPVLPTPSPDPR